MVAVQVEEVVGRSDWRRFLDLPVHLHRGRPGWVPPLATLDRFVLDTRLNPGLHRADESRCLLARRAGRVVGRIAVHVTPTGAWWSHLVVPDREPDGSDAVLAALVVAAREVADGAGAPAIVGPRTPGDPADVGLRTDRHDEPGGLGLPWSPPGLVERLVALGGEAETVRRQVRLPVSALVGTGGATAPEVAADATVPAPYRAWRDRRLELAGPWGSVVAVPDVVAGLAATGVRGAWRSARSAARRSWDACVVLEAVDRAAPGEAVARLAHAAQAAGYGTVTAPRDHLGPDAPDPGEDVAYTRVGFT